MRVYCDRGTVLLSHDPDRPRGVFWTWDPKEVWALITWIIYIVYLHLRLRNKKQGVPMAWFLVISVPVVLFTFAGVNMLMPGLHSYA